MVDNSEAFESVRRNALLSGLGSAVLDRLLKQANMQTIPAGSILIRQGEAGNQAFIILSGALDVLVQTTLGEVCMAELKPFQIVGEIAVFTDLPRTATVRAKEETQVLGLNRNTLADMIVENPNTAFNVIGALGQRINALNTPLALLTLAAQALEREDLAPDSLSQILESSGDESPFARSFQKIVHEMQLKSVRRQEMEFAARLQQSILPRSLDFGDRSPFSVAAFMRPAREVGGDFYDFFHTEDGRVVMVVADVSGKGIPASLFMAVSRTLLRATLLSVPLIEEAVNRTNAQLEEENEAGLFVTVFIAELNLATGLLRYVNAGHCDGYVLRADGDIEVLAPTGPAVAIIPGRKFIAESVRLEPGDLMFVCSDGVTEAFASDGAMFGESGLTQLLAGLSRPRAEKALRAVDEAVSEFSSGCEQSDDITCLALSRSAQD